MKFKTTIALFVLFLSVGFNYAQKVKIKDDTIYFDEVAVLKSDVRYNMYSIFDLAGNELIFVRPFSEIQLTEIKYATILFLNQKIKVETTAENFITIGKKRTVINLIEWLLHEKVLNSKGKINTEKLALFQYKHHEEISKNYRIVNNICNHKHDNCDDEDDN